MVGNFEYVSLVKDWIVKKLSLDQKQPEPYKKTKTTRTSTQKTSAADKTVKSTRSADTWSVQPTKSKTGVYMYTRIPTEIASSYTFRKRYELIIIRITRYYSVACLSHKFP